MGIAVNKETKWEKIYSTIGISDACRWMRYLSPSLLLCPPLHCLHFHLCACVPLLHSIIAYLFIIPCLSYLGLGWGNRAGEIATCLWVSFAFPVRGPPELMWCFKVGVFFYLIFEEEFTIFFFFLSFGLFMWPIIIHLFLKPLVMEEAVSGGRGYYFLVLIQLLVILITNDIKIHQGFNGKRRKLTGHFKWIIVKMVGQLVNRLCWVVEVELLRFHQLAQSKLQWSRSHSLSWPYQDQIKPCRTKKTRLKNVPLLMGGLCLWILQRDHWGNRVLGIQCVPNSSQIESHYLLIDGQVL